MLSLLDFGMRFKFIDQSGFTLALVDIWKLRQLIALLVVLRRDYRRLNVRVQVRVRLVVEVWLRATEVYNVHFLVQEGVL